LRRVFNIAGSLSQIFVLNLRYRGQILLKDEPYGILCNVIFFADLRFNLLNNGRVLEDQPVNIEDSALLA
jgi:hypothetical protein